MRGIEPLSETNTHYCCLRRLCSTSIPRHSVFLNRENVQLFLTLNTYHCHLSAFWGNIKLLL